jgi:hypothetical protein
MKIEMHSFKELENGGAELLLDLDEEGKHYLLNFAIIELVKRGLVEITDMYKEKEDEGHLRED